MAYISPIFKSVENMLGKVIYLHHVLVVWRIMPRLKPVKLAIN